MFAEPFRGQPVALANLAGCRLLRARGRSSPPVPRQAAKPSLNRDATTSSGIVSPGQMAALAAGMSPDTGELVATLESKLDPDVLTDLTWAFLVRLLPPI